MDLVAAFCQMIEKTPKYLAKHGGNRNTLNNETKAKLKDKQA
jgi:hypothetical protein